MKIMKIFLKIMKNYIDNFGLYRIILVIYEYRR